jgi:hypothetical protein
MGSLPCLARRFAVDSEKGKEKEFAAETRNGGM